jgi:hypothetical protein
METKMFEVIDRDTVIPVIATRLNPANEKERYLLSKAGYGKNPATQKQYVILCKADEPSQSSAVSWSWMNQGRTMADAHCHILANWDTLKTGDIIDIEIILEEKENGKPAYGPNGEKYMFISKTCTWAGTIDQAAQTDKGPRCPHCGSKLMNLQVDEAVWTSAIPIAEERDPGYGGFTTWLKEQETCFKNAKIARAEYEKEKH